MNTVENIRNESHQNIYYYFFIFYFLSVAIIDSLNGFMLRTLDLQISVGQISRMLFLLFCLSILVRFFNKKVILPMTLIYILLLFQFVYYFIYYSPEGLLKDILQISKLLLIIISIEAFKRLYDNKLVSKKTIQRIFDKSIVIFPLCLIIPKILGVGYPMYESTNTGFSGFFYAANDLNIVLLTLFNYSLSSSFNNKGKFKYYLFSTFLLLICLLLIGSKSSVVIGGVILIVYIFKYSFRRKLISNIKIFVVFFILFLLSLFILNTFFRDEVNSTLDRHTYFFQNSYIKENNFSSFLLTNRNKFLNSSTETFINSDDSSLRFIFGVGYSKHTLDSGRFVEMDFFDTFFSYGFILTIMIYLYFTSHLIKLLSSGYQKHNFQYIFMFLIIALYSFFGGHVLYSALSGAFLTLTCCMLYALDQESTKKGI